MAEGSIDQLSPLLLKEVCSEMIKVNDVVWHWKGVSDVEAFGDVDGEWSMVCWEHKAGHPQAVLSKEKCQHERLAQEPDVEGLGTCMTVMVYQKQKAGHSEAVLSEDGFYAKPV